jgi:cell division protein FtsB
MVHSWGVYRWGIPASFIEEDLRAELDALKQEKTMLEKRIEEIEKLLKEEN